MTHGSKSFSQVTDEQIAEAVDWMNNYPRRILGGKSPKMGGLGVAITLDKLLYTDGGGLCFYLLEPAIYSRSRFAWKKGQVFSQAAKCFLEFLREYIPAATDAPLAHED